MNVSFDFIYILFLGGFAMLYGIFGMVDGCLS